MAIVENHLKQKFPPDSAARCAQRQMKLAFFEVQRKLIVQVLENWGNIMWTSSKSTHSDTKWAISFSVFLALTLVIDKTLGQAYYFCESKIANDGLERERERAKFNDLVRLTETELFERCKEIFHSSFKTRKNGKEACNPIRDGLNAFRDQEVGEATASFVKELRDLIEEFSENNSFPSNAPMLTFAERDIRSHRAPAAPYLDEGRLACIFLEDCLER
jgi:hypothetical protein